MKKHLILGAIALLALVACTEGDNSLAPDQVEKNGKSSRLIAVVDGCRIWEVYNSEGHNPFFARCPDGAANTFEQYTTGGKTKTTKRVQTLGD